MQLCEGSGMDWVLVFILMILGANTIIETVVIALKYMFKRKQVQSHQDALNTLLPSVTQMLKGYCEMLSPPQQQQQQQPPATPETLTPK